VLGAIFRLVAVSLAIELACRLTQGGAAGIALGVLSLAVTAWLLATLPCALVARGRR
jgi:hypothetical protein